MRAVMNFFPFIFFLIPAGGCGGSAWQMRAVMNCHVLGSTSQVSFDFVVGLFPHCSRSLLTL